MSPFATAKRLIRMILFLVFTLTLMSIVVHTRSSRSIASDDNRRTPSKSSSFWGSLFSRHGRHQRSSSSSSSIPLLPVPGSDVEAVENEDLSDEQIRALSPLEYQQRHRPAMYNSPTLATGPWLLGLVTDLDRESCRERNAATGRTSPTACARANVWVSILKRGILHVVRKRARLRASQHTDPSLQPHNKTAVEWIDETTLESVRPLDSVQRSMSEHNNRGMELSELTWFHGRLLAPDDRTGAVVEISSPHGTLSSSATARLGLDSSSHVPPSVAQRAAAVLRGRDGQHAFKAEWMVIKDDTLVIGGHGRPYTDAAGHAISDDPLWVNQLSLNKQHQTHPEGKNKATSLAFVLSAVLSNVDETPPFLRVMDQQNWADRYKALERAAGVVVDGDDVDNNNNSGSSGFLMHEAVLWSHSRRQWIFLPRRRSVLPFDARTVATMGWNGVLVADEHFTAIQLRHIRDLADPSGLRGFSAAMFLPGSDERVVVALRTIEVEGDAALVDAQVGAAAAANGGDVGSNRVTGLNEKGGKGKWARVTKTFLSAFNIDTGEMVMNEDLVGDQKFEGLTIL